MNLEKLFEMQRKLDDHILEEHPELKNQNNLDWKILALQVELGECANEWGGFKKWSTNQRPRTEIFIPCLTCDGTGDINHSNLIDDLQGGYTHDYIDCPDCDDAGSIGPINPLLEEYVDCLHFILSIGLEIDAGSKYETLNSKRESITEQFLILYCDVADLRFGQLKSAYISLVVHFLGLGEMLGFTWEQIEQAYTQKNEVNHARQESGY